MKIKPLSITIQAINLKGMYKDAVVNTFHDSKLTMHYSLKPSPLGDTYKIRLEYALNDKPTVFVVSPKPLPLAKGETKLPHCYDTKTQRLCLYYPKANEWSKDMLLSKTIIPWVYDWLYHYEIWVGTGDWTGGGIHLTSKN
jgi:hypothetical protein